MIDHREESTTNSVANGALTRRAVLPAFVSMALIPAHLPAQAMDHASNADAGTMWWAELRTHQPQQTVTFYATVLGWTSKVVAQDDTSRPPAAGEQSYTVFTARDEEVAGVEQIAPTDTVASKPGWLVYVQVDNIDDAVGKVTANGGKIIQPPVDVPAFGRMAEIEDPEGNRIGIVSPKT